MKKTIAIITLIAMLLGCVSFNAAAAEAGTYENPQTATNFMGSFLMNTTLEAGNSDGIWYTFTTTAAGIICVENSVQDENRNKIYNYQVAVEVGDFSVEDLNSHFAASFAIVTSFSRTCWA